MCLLTSSDTKMRVTMHLNLWRAAGKMCRKKRPGGIVMTTDLAVNVHFFVHASVLFSFFLYNLYKCFSLFLQPEDGCTGGSGGGEKRARGAEKESCQEAKKKLKLCDNKNNHVSPESWDIGSAISTLNLRLFPLRPLMFGQKLSGVKPSEEEKEKKTF